MSTIPPFDLASRRFKADPHPTYARLRAHAPVYRARLGWRRHAWLLARYDDVNALLRDPRFAKDPRNARGDGGAGPWMPAPLRPLARNMLDLDAPDHTRLRALVQKAFTPRMVDALRPRIQALVDGLIDRATADGRMELVRDLALPLPLTVISDLLGVPEGDRMRFHRLSTTILSGQPGIGALRRRMERIARSMRGRGSPCGRTLLKPALQRTLALARSLSREQGRPR